MRKQIKEDNERALLTAFGHGAAFGHGVLVLERKLRYAVEDHKAWTSIRSHMPQLEGHINLLYIAHIMCVIFLSAYHMPHNSSVYFVCLAYAIVVKSKITRPTDFECTPVIRVQSASSRLIGALHNE